MGHVTKTSDSLPVLGLSVLDQLSLESVDVRAAEDTVGVEDPHSLLEPDAASELRFHALVDDGNGHGDALNKFVETVDGVGRRNGAYSGGSGFRTES